MSTADATKHQRYRAPTDDNTAVVVPPIAELNLGEGSPPASAGSLGGLDFAALRVLARRELLAAAKGYTAAYRDVPPLADDGPLLLTGHQAELFHPGVWFKNFMLSSLASHHAGIGIHLVIDSDEFGSPGIRVPTGSIKAPRVETVRFDAQAAPQPVEVRKVQDHRLLESFAKRVRQTLAPMLDASMVEQLLVDRLWPQVLEAVERNDGNLGLAIAQARHQLEGDWGLATLELPMSHCCRFESFHRFCSGLLLEAGNLREAYNASLAAYRTAHRLRSDAQPMPDLTGDDDWIETPFWVWTNDTPQRMPLFAKPSGSTLHLTNQAAWSTVLDASSPQTLAEQLGSLATSGVCLRTRALTTTLFARTVLGPLFLHGIGGAKYDEVTDDLCRRLWGHAPPAYLTLSATLRLPIQHHSEEPDELRSLQQELRHLEFHPERYLKADWPAEAQAAAAAKTQAIAMPKTPANAANRHQTIVAANQAMQPAVEHLRKRIVTRAGKVKELFRAARVLDSREYSFCLFPADDLRARMQTLVDQSFR